MCEPLWVLYSWGAACTSRIPCVSRHGCHWVISKANTWSSGKRKLQLAPPGFSSLFFIQHLSDRLRFSAPLACFCPFTLNVTYSKISVAFLNKIFCSVKDHVWGVSAVLLMLGFSYRLLCCFHPCTGLELPCATLVSPFPSIACVTSISSSSTVLLLTSRTFSCLIC